MNTKKGNSFSLISPTIIVEKTQPAATVSYDHVIQKPYYYMHQFVAYQCPKNCKQNWKNNNYGTIRTKKVIIERTIFLQVGECR